MSTRDGAHATIVVLAKAPAPGRSKTRLSPPLTQGQAARVAEAALADTLDAVRGTAASRRVLALEGPAGRWLPPGFEVPEQRGHGLDERIAAALSDVGGPAFLIGMDTPQVTPALLTDCLTALGQPHVDAVLGPAVDGGWWGLGLRRPDPRALLGVPMGSVVTGAAQRARLRSLGLAVRDLPPLRDVDLIPDALAVAAQAPRSRFAATLADVLADAVRSWTIRGRDGRTLDLPASRWFGEPGPEEHEVLDLALGPVLDVGCGPGRHSLALARKGVAVLGIDTAAPAVRLARRRGAPVLHRSVFGRLPDAGRWNSALLLDGNVGIGGDPPRLLRRIRQMLAPRGRALLEVEPPGTSAERMEVRLEAARPGPWFGWARLGVDGLADVAAEAGFAVGPVWRRGARWFARLDRP